MPKLLLIYPTMITETPMTFAMLSAVAKQEGWNTATCINTFKKPLKVEDFVNSAKKFRADLVGISMLTFEVLFIYEIIKALKKEGFIVMVGGPHPTDIPEECIENGADIVIIGEAEEILRNILREYPNIKKGIRDRKPYVDLATLPIPDLEVFDKDLFTGEDGLIKGFHRIYTSRGCPGSCTFCDWQIFKQCWRPYPVDTIIADIKRRVENYGITSFSIADDCFTVDHKRAYDFCNKISQIKPKITWRTNSRATLVNPQLLKALKESNCHSIAYGLESGDPETLLKIRKFVTREQNIKACWMAHEAGLEVYGCLMTGFPWETIKNVESQISFVHETWEAVSLFQVSGSLMPFPGTAIYKEYAKKCGFEKYWLKPKYQQFGIQVYQNALNPFVVSNYYQRYLFDDTYIKNEYFFKYTPEYMAKVRELVWEIGKHNLLFMFPNNPARQKLSLALSKLSMIGEDLFPGLEKKVGGYLFEKFHSPDRRAGIEKIRDKRRGIVKTR